MARWNIEAQAGGHRVTRARLVFWKSGANSMGANSIDKKIYILDFFLKMNAHSCQPPPRASTLETPQFHRPPFVLLHRPATVTGLLKIHLPKRLHHVFFSNPESHQVHSHLGKLPFLLYIALLLHHSFILPILRSIIHLTGKTPFSSLPG